MKTKTVCAAAIAALTFAVIGAFSPAQAAPQWAPAGSATIHPGVMTFTEGAQCTANFVFTDAAANVYIGQAAHCSGTGAATDTNGCDAESLPIGTQVEIDGASQPGTMVYNSWLTMQSANEQNADACNYNDFALVQLDPADYDKVNPSIPAWGGPVGIAGPTSFGDSVYSYGNSSLRLGISQLSPKTGTSLGTIPSGWSHPVYTVTPGIPGDSGSAFLDKDGNALGVLSTLAIAPLPASNNVSDIGLALQYMDAHSSVDVTLAPGTEPFNPGLLGLNGLLGG
jgi:hypothetical protein